MDDAGGSGGGEPQGTPGAPEEGASPGTEHLACKHAVQEAGGGEPQGTPGAPEEGASPGTERLAGKHAVQETATVRRPEQDAPSTPDLAEGAGGAATTDAASARATDYKKLDIEGPKIVSGNRQVTFDDEFNRRYKRIRFTRVSRVESDTPENDIPPPASIRIVTIKSFKDARKQFDRLFSEEVVQYVYRRIEFTLSFHAERPRTQLVQHCRMLIELFSEHVRFAPRFGEGHPREEIQFPLASIGDRFAKELGDVFREYLYNDQMWIFKKAIKNYSRFLLEGNPRDYLSVKYAFRLVISLILRAANYIDEDILDYLVRFSTYNSGIIEKYRGRFTKSDVLQMFERRGEFTTWILGQLLVMNESYFLANFLLRLPFWKLKWSFIQNLLRLLEITLETIELSTIPKKNSRTNGLGFFRALGLDRRGNQTPDPIPSARRTLDLASGESPDGPRYNSRCIEADAFYNFLVESKKQENRAYHKRMEEISQKVQDHVQSSSTLDRKRLFLFMLRYVTVGKQNERDAIMDILWKLVMKSQQHVTATWKEYYPVLIPETNNMMIFTTSSRNPGISRTLIRDLAVFFAKKNKEITQDEFEIGSSVRRLMEYDEYFRRNWERNFQNVPRIERTPMDISNVTLKTIIGPNPWLKALHPAVSVLRGSLAKKKTWGVVVVLAVLILLEFLLVRRLSGQSGGAQVPTVILL